MIRVVLADDEAMIRSGLRLILESEPDLKVVAEAATGREAVDATLRHRPDVVLMDVQMPDMDGLEATPSGLRPDRRPRCASDRDPDTDDLRSR